MNRNEAIRQNEQEANLLDLGFTRDEAAALRRISMTLRRWYEMECGTGDDRVSRSIERDEITDKPFMRIQFQSAHGWVDRSYPTPDREKGAIKRLDKIIADRNAREIEGAERIQDAPDGNRYAHFGKNEGPFLTLEVKDLSYYLQTDPRGASLYIIRPGDVPEGKDVSAYYSRALCVY